VGAISTGRRALDLVVALSALVLLWPLLLGLALVVRLSSPGPVIFRQQRLTRGHATFTMYKFRTMRAGVGGPEVTSAGDARVTGPGRLMRRTSLDELPQLINVLRGQMTLVGPRPETPALAAKYPDALQWVLDETPGLTGPAQITLRDDVTVSGSVDDVEQWYIERLVPRRVAADLTFLCRPTLLATMHVIVMTVRYLLRGRRPGIRAAA
jgi:lipopolysaccharide/colanic/teichoic acid biosynthesis glycosyltransferase